MTLYMIAIAIIGASLLGGYAFARSQAGYGRSKMYTNSAVAAFIPTIIGLGFLAMISQPSLLVGVLAIVVALAGTAFFLPAFYVARSRKLESLRNAKASLCAEIVRMSFNDLSEGKDFITARDLRVALERSHYTSGERAAIRELLKHIEQAGVLVESNERKVFMPVRPADVPVTIAAMDDNEYHITRDSLKKYAANKRSAW